MESIIGIVLVFPLGIWVGYRWRDRISQQRRALYKAERYVRETVERCSRRDIPNISEAITELVEIKTPAGGNDKLE
jgi:hypothetical protein